MGTEEELMKRWEVVALLKELVAEQLIQPSLVFIDQRKPERYQLQIKGDYNIQEIELFVKNRFSVQEYDGYLIFNNP